MYDRRESVKVNSVAKYLCYILLSAVCTHIKGFKKKLPGI